MNRQRITFRIGADDIGEIFHRLNGAVNTDVLFSGFGQIDHQLGDVVTKLHAIGLQPSEKAFDLAIVAAAVTAADTRINRATEGQDGWTREIELCIPVQDQQLWMAMTSLLEGMLNFLTGDRWTLTFRTRVASVAQLVPPVTETLTNRPLTVCLFSGGLDSFIGAIDLLAQNERVLFISHYWDSVTSKHQGICLQALNRRFADTEFQSIQARVGFPTTMVEGSSGENTLRGRSFLFFSLAALAADAISRDNQIAIHVPENGLISLNVPLDPLRLGSLSTRTTHPYYMSRFNEVLSNLGLMSGLQNAYRHKTKGQMVAECLDQDFLREEARNTISCSSPAKARFSQDEERRQSKNCGHCVPCLIRRAALLHGFGEDDGEYQLEDLQARELDSCSAEGEHVRSFKLAISRLNAKPGRVKFDIHKPGPLIDFPDDWDAYEAVYRNGIDEVARLLQKVEVRPKR
ncbi:MAG: hypothetical protein E8D43_00375 [Nitrospira sp.]|nr:MAG: hypothetical protein E8D43_00375 [Nitrospira sp.]